MITITHARIVNADIPSFVEKLNITIPYEKLEEARTLLKEHFLARILLTYTIQS